MSNLDRAITLTNDLNDVVEDALDTAECFMDRVGKHHPQYDYCSRYRETMLEIIDLLDDVDAKLHDLDREEVIL